MALDLSTILLETRRLTPQQAEQACEQARRMGKELDEVVIGLEMLTEEQLAAALGSRLGIPGLALAQLPRPNARVTKLVPEELARLLGIVPLERAGDTLILLMRDPTDLRVIEKIRAATRCEIQPVVAGATTVKRALDTFYVSPERKLLDNVVPFVGKLITEETARAYRALPVDRDGNLLTVAIAGDPEKTRRAIELATGLQVRTIAAPWEEIEKAITRVHHGKPAATPAAAPVRHAAAAPAAPPQAIAPPAAAAPAHAPARPMAAAPAASSVVTNLDDFLGGQPAPAPGLSAPPPPAGSPAMTTAAPAATGSLDIAAFLGAPSSSLPAASKPGPGNGNGNGGKHAAPSPLSFGATPPGDGLDTATARAAAASPPASKPAATPVASSLDSFLDGSISTTPEAAASADVLPNETNLSAAGSPGGPHTGLRVEASTRQQMKELAARTWGELDPKLAKIVPEKVARNYRIVVTGRLEKKIFIAMENPRDLFAIETVEFVTRLRVEVTQATPEQIEAGIEVLYGLDEDAMAALRATLDGADMDGVETREDMEYMTDLDAAAAADQAPVVSLVNMIIRNAIDARASDIHFEIFETDMRIRFRIDGVLREVMRPPIDLRDPITSRVKIMGRMDISERRLPQDGRMRLRKGPKGNKKDIDFRISTMPTVFGEKIVMRILDRDTVRTDLTELGFEPEPLSWFREAIHKPYGMCLVVGPSGSGKTNTLYSALSDVNTPDVNVITCEDPVEFGTKGLNQVQARESIGLSFATALRSFLRQDPNIIFVGEIRDFETAEIAVKAALTGHLVMSTLHTNDAPAAITRMTNMGVEPFLIATSVHVVVAQRLVRRVCLACKQRDPIAIEQLVQMGFPPDEARTITPLKGVGCPECEHSGYKGRLGLFEVLRLTNEMRELVLCNASSGEVKQLALRQGMRTLRMAGLQKVREGLTSCEEVIRETIG
jgi:type IV pilus assembly protein PilB